MSAENPTPAEREMFTRLYDGSPSLINDTMQDIADRQPTALELEHISARTAVWALQLRNKPVTYQECAEMLAQLVPGAGRE